MDIGLQAPEPERWYIEKAEHSCWLLAMLTPEQVQRNPCDPSKRSQKPSEVLTSHRGLSGPQNTFSHVLMSGNKGLIFIQRTARYGSIGPQFQHLGGGKTESGEFRIVLQYIAVGGWQGLQNNKINTNTK